MSQTKIETGYPDALPEVIGGGEEEARLAAQAETNAGVARATGILALGNIASRVLGLAREIALTNLIGAGSAIDAFEVATSIPLAFYDLLIGGNVSSALIPVLSEVVTKEGRDALWKLVSILVSLVGVVLAVLILILELFAPTVVRLAGGSGFSAATLELSINLLRLTGPALIFMCLFAVLSGALYALRTFTWPAFAGAAFNACIVICTVALAPAPIITAALNGMNVHWASARPTWGIMAAAVGWLVGSLVQLALQLPGLRGGRLHFSLNWRHPAIRQIGRLYAPVMFSLIMDTLVIRPFSYNIASQTGAGSIGYMGWATTLIQFPQGLVATAISIAILPTLARQAALITPEGNRAFKDTLGHGLRLASSLILPATVGLFVLATPIVALLFQHGAFLAKDTVITVMALRLYLFGLPFAALDLLLVYAFYARQDTLTPALIGLVSLIVYMVTAVVLLPRAGLFSLMIADSMKQITHAALSAYFLSRRIEGFGGQRLLLTFGKSALAAFVMGAVGWALTPTLTHHFATGRLLDELVVVGVAGGISLGVFVALAALLRINEIRWIGGMLRQRFIRST